MVIHDQNPQSCSPIQIKDISGSQLSDPHVLELRNSNVANIIALDFKSSARTRSLFGSGEEFPDEPTLDNTHERSNIVWEDNWVSDIQAQLATLNKLRLQKYYDMRVGPKFDHKNRKIGFNVLLGDQKDDLGLDDCPKKTNGLDTLTILSEPPNESADNKQTCFG